MDFGGAGGLGEHADDVGQSAFPARQERPNDGSAELRVAPSGRYDDDARELSGVDGLEVDHRGLDRGGEMWIGSGVEGCPGDRCLWTGRQDRPGPDEILVHCRSIAGLSANWVA